MEALAEDLQVNQERLARALRWPENMGVEMREIKVGPNGQKPGLMVWIDGMAAPSTLPQAVVETLCAHLAAEGPQAHALPMQRVEVTRDFTQAVNRLLAGWILLLLDGTGAALLLESRRDGQDLPAKEPIERQADTFTRDLRMNVALVRKRLRSTELLALAVPFPPQRAGGIALVYLAGRADPAVVRAVRRWASAHMGEEAASRGVVNRASAALGLLPRFAVTPWVDKAAALVDAGYVLLLVDRIECAYIAPVTAPNWLTSASDSSLTLPLRRWLLRFRLALCLGVLLMPGTVVALLNYHQEMIPTAFLLAIGSARESAPFGTIFEVLLLEVLVEIAREGSIRLPVAVPIGLTLIAYLLLTILAVQVGFVGTVPALAAAIGAVMALALPDQELAYLVRVWRFIFIGAALVFGFFGMAAIFAIFVSYLCQARSWGVPFLGPAGLDLTAVESWSSRKPEGKGGGRSGKTLVR